MISVDRSLSLYLFVLHWLLVSLRCAPLSWLLFICLCQLCSQPQHHCCWWWKKTALLHSIGLILSRASNNLWFFGEPFLCYCRVRWSTSVEISFLSICTKKTTTDQLHLFFTDLAVSFFLSTNLNYSILAVAIVARLDREVLFFSTLLAWALCLSLSIYLFISLFPFVFFSFSQFSSVNGLSHTSTYTHTLIRIFEALLALPREVEIRRCLAIDWYHQPAIAIDFDVDLHGALSLNCFFHVDVETCFDIHVCVRVSVSVWWFVQYSFRIDQRFSTWTWTGNHRSNEPSRRRLNLLNVSVELDIDCQSLSTQPNISMSLYIWFEQWFLLVSPRRPLSFSSSSSTSSSSSSCSSS